MSDYKITVTVVKRPLEEAVSGLREFLENAPHDVIRYFFRTLADAPRRIFKVNSRRSPTTGTADHSFVLESSDEFKEIVAALRTGDRV